MTRFKTPLRALVSPTIERSLLARNGYALLRASSE
jgi:hypothetical protein